MSILKTAIVLPLLVAPGAFDLGHATPAAYHRVHEAKDAQRLNEEVVIRQLRIEKILMALDRMAEVTAHMHPERAETIEPVLLELAGQTLDLTNDRAVLDRATDSELEKIEQTVDRLMSALQRLVEPEMSI